MINSTHHQINHYPLPFSNKLSVIWEDELVNKREEMINYLYSFSTSNSLIFLDGKKSMVPFLSVEDNLLLSLSRKEKKDVLPKIRELLPYFRLEDCLLKSPASDVSYANQVLFLMIRAMILNQTTILFDDYLNKRHNDLFINNILPILNLLTKSQKVNVIVVTKNRQLAESIYYDQCIFLSQLFK